MSQENAYNKLLTTESKMDKIEGVLDHLNLPPRAIDFIRKHNRAIQIAIAVIVVFVVFWSFYGSYSERVREEGASALSQAMKQNDNERTQALQQVATEFSSTTSGLWASVELAHLAMNKGDFGQASIQYRELLSSVKKAHPLYPLVLYGLAQSQEAEKNFLDAANNYDILKEIQGYKHIAYLSLGRLEEIQNNEDKAIAIYNNFILSVGDDPSFTQSRLEISSRIARIKAKR